MAAAPEAAARPATAAAASSRLAVDVIVPVYRGLAQTRRCIESVLAAPQLTPYELILINDCSPEPEIAAYLASLAGRPGVQLLANDHNLGFVATVNRGMALHPQRDVVLLNADTEVANDWLDRLQRCATSRSDIGTVTPFSNNATICSYPEFCRDNPLPDELSLAELDRLFRRVNAGKAAEIPTAVGFCMYIRRDCLKRIGPFDAARFGKGYGEENDFSRRAVHAGWLNVLCADTCVYHEGGASFQSEQAALQLKAGATLDALHPDYAETVRRFIALDPLRELRQAIDLERALRRRPLQGTNPVAPDSKQPTDLSTMKTVVCLNVRPATAAFAPATIASIVLHSPNCCRIVVATTADGGADRAACLEAAGGIPLEFVAAAERLAALRTALQESAAAGAFLVSAGMSLPNAFDVRLASLAQQACIATVSPFCDHSPAHRVRDAAAGGMSEADLSRLDRLAFLLGQRTCFEVGGWLEDCCFISAAAVQQLPDPDGLHVLSDSIYVGAQAGAPASPGTTPPKVAAAGLEQSRKAIVDAWQAGTDFREAPGLTARPVQLHVIHDLGGGSTKWLHDFARADPQRINLVLRSFGHDSASGGGVALFSHVLDETPLRARTFTRAIDATAAAHLEYRGFLAEIIRDYCVDAVVVSSLIGHSLDILDTGLPTAVVSHDYFPYCAAINIHFDGVCTRCDDQRVDECFRGNPRFNPFTTFRPRQRIEVRDRFLDLARRANVTLVAPSRSVEENLRRLDARFNEVAFATIPHGYGRPLQRPRAAGPAAPGRLRVLVLGQISVLKGLDLLSESLQRIREFAEVYLVGCRELGELFRFERNVHVVSHYEIDELAGHVAAIDPHVGLLTSICPETFSYALTELMMLGVPAVATRVGSFPERIRHQENGYLYTPDSASLLETLRAIDADRATLGRVRENLLGWAPRTAEAMVADYHRTLPLDARPAARNPLHPAPLAPANAQPPRDAAALTQALALADMWKSIKSLHLQLSMLAESRQRAENHIRLLEGQRQSMEFERQQAQQRFEAEKLLLAGQMTEQGKDAARRVAALQASLDERDRAIHSLTAQATAVGEQLSVIRASTSWRVTRPLRFAGHLLRKTRALGGYLRTLLRDPLALPANVALLGGIWRSSGSLAVRRRLQAMRAESDHQDAWRLYHRAFRREVRPLMRQRIDAMPAQPLISVLVPTFNTPEPMLRQMVQSVRQQLYPAWQLCIADDGSSLPHVRRVLEEFAAKDSRIRLHFVSENKGVSHASNRALDLAAGDFVVLLDHDDLLEEQALFRVAESILEDEPDMVYSDEAMVSVDVSQVQQYAFRPAFSPEYLRGHPYFVHLLGFRRNLLLDIGGFDESLNISQDYDLILRASEKARKIVHIPEILYQWRIHGGSAGQQRMREVMETSKAILQRHLQRCGDTGRVEDGAGFNLFDTRYPLGEGLKVAIIIPTKNHGQLVRQCIDSIRATVSEVVCDILVVDHESDDPDTLDYFSSLGGNARVLHYAGPFNFSAINNWAIAQLDGSHSHYLLCNNDIEATHPGWLGRMLELGQHPDVGIVGATLLYPDGVTIQHAGVCVGTFGAAEHYAKFLRKPDVRHYLGFSEILASNHEVSAVTAACLLIRKEAFAAIAGFDEALAVGFGDVDLCLRVGQQGYRILQCPHAELLHHESFTRGKSAGDPHPQDSALYRAKWQAFLQAGDPFFNPNLSLNSTAWQMRYPISCQLAIRRRVSGRGVFTGRQAPGAHP